LVFLISAPHSARADCATPGGVTGDIFYNSDYGTYQFCDGTDWWTMKGSATTGGGTFSGGGAGQGSVTGAGAGGAAGFAIITYTASTCSM